ncbi:cation:proton antiporter [Methylobacterium sp. WSM2598]|uniref:cation:proton antiporter n=1 Tax=Methylobacterium sp. WSM2598 TaxID=398261 RepID=UPI00037035AD|nr:cation:proton antiporter [Methylobacterium sp. WSM2598]
MYQNIAILFAFVFAYSLVAAPLERTPVAGALVFTAFGLALGPMGLNLLEIGSRAQVLKTLAELTLALVLFMDAANADLGVLRRSYAIPVRLLLVGLPLTLVLGTAAAYLLFPTIGLLGCALLSTILAPTDAALGKAVVTNPSVPAAVREGLNVESGLNDGICVPVLLILLALAADRAADNDHLQLVMSHFVREIGIGLVTGVGLAVIGVWGLRWAERRGWMGTGWRQMPAVALAITSFAAAQALGGSGFIASFVGGLAAGWMARRRTVKHELLMAAEGAGNVLALLTWALFGATVVSELAPRLGWEMVAYAGLSLTVIRMAPAWIALAGSGVDAGGKVFLGWFGPRGLASIVFAVLVLDAEVPGSDLMAATVACTVILSVVAHGLTANPLSDAFARHAARRSEPRGAAVAPGQAGAQVPRRRGAAAAGEPLARDSLWPHA